MAIYTMTHDAAEAHYTMDEMTARAYGWDTEKHGPLMMHISFEGCVLSTGEHNYYDDSDFYALVWDGTMVKEVEYGSTRGWSYPNHAKVDATPEVLEAVATWRANIKAEQDRIAAEKEKTTVRVDKMVKVVKGRKIAKGTIARVISIRRNEYDASNPCVMVQFDRKIVTTYMNNLEVVQE